MSISALRRWRSSLAATCTMTLLAALMAFVGVSPANAATEVSFSGTELLGTPTDTSIAINVVPDANIDLYYEYGTSPGTYTASTSTELAVADQPHETTVSGLSPDTRYYYRMQYQIPGDSGWVVRDEHTFHTARASGEDFVFTVTSDSHLGMMGSSATYENTTLNVAADQPDLSFDLGDTFITNNTSSQADVDQVYLTQRPYIGNYGDSTPVFLTPGNHENEEGWNWDDSPFSKAVASIQARKAYYPTPNPTTPGSFYTTDSVVHPEIAGDGYAEGYYAFEWGDALFVVINPFHFTMTNPYGATAGEDNDEVVSGDQWVWTLGADQYNWLKQTLQNSDAPFKFVFSHQVTGGQLVTGGSAGAPSYVRGGANAADYWEWGGHDGTGAYTFDTERPGWGEPIQDLFVDNGVTAYFHGHDHQYAYEIVDGVVYQSMPSASMTDSNGFNLYSESDPETYKVLPSAGYLRVTVSPTTGLATADYVRSSSTGGGINGTVSYTYTMAEGEESASPILYRVNAGGSTLTALSGPAYVGISANGTTGGITVSGATSNSTTSAVDLSGVSLDLDSAAAEDLFQSTLYTTSSMSWAFDVPDGNYDVKLHMIEQQASFEPGDRVFDVAFEGDVLLDDFDVLARNGGVAMKAYTETVPVTVSDGELNIDFTNGVSYANVRGIEVIQTEGPDETPPVITLSGAAEMWVEVGGSFVDPGATAYDAVDGSVLVVVGGDTVDTSTIGDYVITYNAVDAADNHAIEKTRTVHVTPETGIVYRVNAGGPALASTYGPSFTGISGDGTSGGITVSGTTSNSTTEAVDLSAVDLDLTDANAEALFQSTLYTTDSMSWGFDVADGIYQVKLHLIEQQADFVKGDRLVDVAMEGAVRLNDLDVYDEAGGIMKALTKSVLVAVDDGELNIDFTNVESYANIRGIEIIEAEDNEAPVISLLGANPMTVEAGSSFTDPGATVTDNVDPTTTITGVSTVNTGIPGDYTVTYNHTDTAGNAATTVVRDVEVVDTTAPVITLLGSNPLYVLQGTSFSDPGATATDTVDGNLTASIVVGGDTVNTEVAGNYGVTYNVCDSAHNCAGEVTRTVIVTSDLPPEITLLGSNPQVIEGGAAYVEAGATATDHEDGNLTASIVIDATAVDTSKVGDYGVEYSVTDSYGNTTTETRTARVVDTTAPVITLLGTNPMTIDVGDAFTDPGASVSDNVDATSTIVGAGTVNTGTPGNYSVAYDYTDDAGNAAITVIRTVSVVDSTPPPTFTDDDGSVFEADIAWLADRGITRGCNPPVNDMFCPDAPTTRGQMAAFFHRALGDVIPVDIDNVIVFDDTRASVFMSDIEWLSATGITKGCNPPANDMFCPEGNVTRGQMAAFIRRAFGDMIPTPASSGLVFTDTQGNVFASDIQWLADTGITKGCGADTFCPNANVTRGEMAAFFRRAFTAAGL